MEKTLVHSTSDLRLPSYVAQAHSALTSPNALVQGTAVPCAETSRVRVVEMTGASGIGVLPVQVAFEFLAGARSTDLPGLLPRPAPV